VYSFSRLNRYVSFLEDAGLYAGAAVMIFIMVVVSMDAILRYTFNAPISWAYDTISLYGLVLIGYLPMSATFREGAHVSVSIFYDMFSSRNRNIIRIFVTILNLVFCAFFLALAFKYTLKAYHETEVRMGVIIFLIWPSYLPIALGFLVIVARLVLSLAMLIAVGRDPYVTLDGEVME